MGLTRKIKGIEVEKRKLNWPQRTLSSVMATSSASNNNSSSKKKPNMQQTWALTSKNPLKFQQMKTYFVKTMSSPLFQKKMTQKEKIDEKVVVMQRRHRQKM